jgi:iron complex transport system substrate-binding protein
MQLHKLPIVFAALLAALLLAVACGDDDADDVEENTGTPATGSPQQTDLPEEFYSCEGDVPGEAPDTAAFPVEVTDPSGRTVTIEEPPEAIASLSAGHTEILYGIRADDQVLAVDNTSDCPVEAGALSARVDAFNLSVESVIALEPDLVILFYDPGDVVSSLEDAGITVLLQDIQSVSEYVTAQFESPTVYHELDAQLFSAGPGSFIGDFYAKLGAENIATEPYPQLSAETIIAADPDVIVLADEGLGETPETVGARPGWDAITAVREERIYGIDPDIVSRPGPRVVDAIRILADYLYGTEFSY